MRNREVKQRLRKAFDNAAPALKHTERSFRPIHIGEPFPSEKKYRQPLPRWTLAAAAAVLLFFCGFIGFHAHPFAAKSRIETAAGPGEGLSPTPAPAVSATAAPTTEPTGVTVQAKEPASDATLLDEATVKALILSHAELTEAAVQYWRAKLDRENGRLVYEAELTADGVEFEYEVDAMTGEIVKCEREQLAANPVPAEEPIGEEKAKEIALQHAGVSTADAEQLRVKADWEDNRRVYEVEFVANETEYDYEIDAVTGQILKSEKETVRKAADSSSAAKGSAAAPAKKSGSSQQSSGINEAIGTSKAKEIALKHAGVSASKAKRLRVETDRENGRQVYEVEFTADGIEYDYEIDALTGKILKHEAERDDD